MSRKINTVSIMQGTVGTILSYTMTELADDGTVIRGGLRKSKALKDADIEYNNAVTIIKSKLETEENM